MKQKIYEILTSHKIQTNSVILNNCIDYVCLFFDRLLLLDLSAVQVTFQDRKTNLFVHFLGEVSAWQFHFEIYWPLVLCHVFVLEMLCICLIKDRILRVFTLLPVGLHYHKLHGQRQISDIYLIDILHIIYINLCRYTERTLAI